jgi:phosphoglycolate phosphatase
MVSKYKNILFDLDGTITDPSEGITRCYAYAVEKMGEPVPLESELLKFIGPPLRLGFAQVISDPTIDRVEEAVRLYRERFTDTGIFEVELTPGVADVMRSLKASGKRLFVVTSKTQAFAERTLAHFNLLQYLDGVYGSSPTGELDDKKDILALCLKQEALDPAECVMIGDRLHDVLAAREHGIRTIGVRCGFAQPGELEELACLAIVNDLRGLIAKV